MEPQGQEDFHKTKNSTNKKRAEKTEKKLNEVQI